ncbi:MAG: RelA/SpoT family protein, partial [Gaiellaceae bacterium]
MTVLESAERHQELIDELIESVATYNKDVDRDLLTRAFTFAAAAHEGQQRRSGEDFINHPWGAAKICAELHLDEQTIAAALLHDVVEDTGTDIKDVRAEFGDEVATLVEGVTKLTRIQFQSREQAEAENYRKMIVAMAQDVRVILIKLADRLHNMRTIEYLGKQKQVQKAKETLEVYAPLAHRLGINKIKWELEDLAFATLHPRKYEEIKAMVSERRADREEHVREAAMTLQRELEKVDIPADISGRAKHFYSIYDKMAKKGREFNEIYDLTAMRVIAERDGEEGTRDCYGALGLIHSLWKPMPGRFKDYVAMPKLNGYQALHTTVIGPEGRPLEIQIRTMEMHRTAEFGVAAHWIYKEDGSKPVEEKVEWLRHLLDWQQEMADPQEFAQTLKADLFEDEVFVFTPKGEVKSLGAGATPLDFAYEVHTDVGHRCVGAKVNGKIVPLHYELKSGDICEVLTSKKERGPSRDWLSLAKTTR